ncbi:MAG: Mrp/NBP35 family ATP-binding protein [Proteobacteria bacterium]|nr:Mrp/NBP35 family ATP-binding protein [Pseudomonadota bacterium]
MRRLVVSSLKGGTGKTSTTVNLGKALQRAGYRVGLLDADATAPTLFKALGMNKPPALGVDSRQAKLRPFEVDGLYALTLASHYGENPAVLWDEPTLIRAMRELIRDVIWPELDYLILDSPPSSSGFMQALFDALAGDIYGTVLVFQPSDIAVADLVRTLDFIKIKRVPVVGLISNMAYCISPKGEKFWPFISPNVDIGDICGDHGIPQLGEVPLTPQQGIIDREFDKIAQRVVDAKPLVLKDSMLTKLYKRIAKETVKSVVRRF